MSGWNGNQLPGNDTGGGRVCYQAKPRMMEIDGWLPSNMKVHRQDAKFAKVVYADETDSNSLAILASWR
jgi:hypothetical protein